MALIRILNISCRVFSTKHSLIGKHFVDPSNLNAEEIKSLLWTALELKELDAKNKLCNCRCMKDLERKRVFFLAKEDMVEHSSLISANHMIGTKLTKVISPKWDEIDDLTDIRKYIEMNADFLFCHTNTYYKIKRMVIGKTIPIVCVFNCRYALPITLADVMAVYESIGKIRGLNVTWIGCTCPLMCSQLCIFTLLGMHLNYCTTGEPVSPIVLPEVNRMKAANVRVQEFFDCGEAIKDADVIIFRHPDSKFTLKKSYLEKAKPNWLILENFPRSDGQVDKAYDDRNLIWQCSKNLKYVIGAIIVRFLTNYEHKTKPPLFD